MEYLQEFLKQKMKRENTECLIIDDGRGPIITLNFPGTIHEKIFINSTPWEKCDPADIQAVKDWLGIKEDYTDPLQNPAIPDDNRIYPSKKDEINYTDPVQNPAIIPFADR